MSLAINDYKPGDLAQKEQEDFNEFLKLHKSTKKFYFEKYVPNYEVKEDAEWEDYALQYKEISSAIENLEVEKEKIRNKLVEIAGDNNIKGSGIHVCRIERKGNIDYSSIEILRDIDLDQYRKPSSTSWRITIDENAL